MRGKDMVDVLTENCDGVVAVLVCRRSRRSMSV